MSRTALETLVERERALIAALDADDVAAIADASAAIDAAMRDLDVPAEARALAEEAVRLAEAARVRINVLADMTERRLTRLATASGRGTAAPVYGRNARLKR